MTDSRCRRPAAAPWWRRAARSSPCRPRRATPQPDGVAGSRALAGVVPRRQVVSYFSDKSGEYSWFVEQDGLKPPREIDLAKANFHFTPAWSPDSKKLLFTDTNLNVWVVDVASGAREDRGHRSVDGAGSLASPDLVARLEGVAFANRLNSLYRAIFVAERDRREATDTDGLSDATFPAGTPAASTCGSSPPRTSGWDAVAGHVQLRPPCHLCSLSRDPEEG